MLYWTKEYKRRSKIKIGREIEDGDQRNSKRIYNIMGKKSI